jgi:hypothetical protein
MQVNEILAEVATLADAVGRKSIESGCAAPPPDPAARLQVYEAALRRISQRAEHEDAVIRLVRRESAADIAREALAWKK